MSNGLVQNVEHLQLFVRTEVSSKLSLSRTKPIQAAFVSLRVFITLKLNPCPFLLLWFLAVLAGLQAPCLRRRHAASAKSRLHIVRHRTKALLLVSSLLSSPLSINASSDISICSVGVVPHLQGPPPHILLSDTRWRRTGKRRPGRASRSWLRARSCTSAPGARRSSARTTVQQGGVAQVLKRCFLGLFFATSVIC